LKSHLLGVAGSARPAGGRALRVPRDGAALQSCTRRSRTGSSIPAALRRPPEQRRRPGDPKHPPKRGVVLIHRERAKPRRPARGGDWARGLLFTQHGLESVPSGRARRRGNPLVCGYRACPPPPRGPSEASSTPSRHGHLSVRRNVAEWPGLESPQYEASLLGMIRGGDEMNEPVHLPAPRAAVRSWNHPKPLRCFRVPGAGPTIAEFHRTGGSSYPRRGVSGRPRSRPRSGREPRRAVVQLRIYYTFSAFFRPVLLPTLAFVGLVTFREGPCRSRGRDYGYAPPSLACSGLTTSTTRPEAWPPTCSAVPPALTNGKRLGAVPGSPREGPCQSQLVPDRRRDVARDHVSGLAGLPRWPLGHDPDLRGHSRWPRLIRCRRGGPRSQRDSFP